MQTRLGTAIFAAGWIGICGFQTCAAQWAAGAATTDITPTRPVRLSGYGNRTGEHEGVAMSLHAKALALVWKKEAPLVMLTVDNCGVPAEMRAEVLARVQKEGFDLRDERFSLHSSHTHCAPMLPGVLPFLFGKELTAEEKEHVRQYGDELTAKMTGVVAAALKSASPAQLDWGVGAVRFAMNRRMPTPNGYTNSPYPMGPVDHDLPVLRVRDASGKLRAIFTSYACHCTTLGINQTHPDWAGCAQKELELRYPGSVALTAIGCGGDQNPNPRRELELAELHGVSLAKEALEVMSRPMLPLSGPIVSKAKTISLPFEPLPNATTLKERMAKEAGKAGAQHAKHFLELGDKAPKHLPYMIQAWSFGADLLMINLPGEVVVDYGLRFKKAYGSGRTWVNAYTNDVPCYIPSQRVWEEGGYEAATAMIYYGRPNRFASGVEELIAKAVAEVTTEWTSGTPKIPGR